MRTTDLFKFNRSSKRINESFEKTFGKTLKLETFSIEQLEDARNKLRTQIYTARQSSGFNETIENETLTQAQFMHDAIVAELMDRAEHIVDTTEVEEGMSPEVEQELHQIAVSGDYDKLYDLLTSSSDTGKAVQDMYDEVARDYGLHPDDDHDDILDRLMDRLEDDYGESDEDSYDDSMDGDHDSAMASAGFGSDEDYESYQAEESDKETKAAHDAGYRDAAQGKTKNPFNPGSPSAKHYDDGQDSYKRHFGESSVAEKAPPGAKAERMVKHIKKGYAKDGKLTDKEKSIAYATAWKQHNKEKNESVETGDDMTRLQEGEIQQASAIVTAKTMVDRVGRWIEELSGMENDTLLQLGDSIRDEMGQEQAKGFIEAVAPAIQQALENLKSTREALASGVRQLTGEEQGAEMLGAEEPASDEMGAAEPDAMNAEPAADDFAAAEPAAGGAEAAGRAQRESIDRGNNLLKVLAG